LLNRSANSGKNESAVALATSVASSCRHRPSVGIRGGEPLVELLLEDSGGAAELRGPVGCRSPASTQVAALNI
jgi:hypothetical protein